MLKQNMKIEIVIKMRHDNLMERYDNLMMRRHDNSLLNVIIMRHDNNIKFRWFCSLLKRMVINLKY